MPPTSTRPFRPLGALTPAVEVTAGSLSAAGAGTLRFAVEVAAATGPWEPVGTLSVEGPLPDERAESLRFNPGNTGGRLHPVGVLQTIRRRAYRGSQAARPTPSG